MSITSEHEALCIGDSEWQLFVESAPYVESLVADIRSAQRRVWVESYTVADDGAGRAVAEALKERAAAGVECRLLYDTVGSLQTPERFFADLRNAGVAVVAYRPVGNWLRRLWFWRKFHRRDHRKLVVLDDRLAYFGGMNLVDQGGSLVPGTPSEEHRRGEPPWRDVQVRIAGSQAVQVAAAWNDLWSHVHRLPSESRVNPTPREILRAQGDAVFFFDARPHVKHRRPGRVLVKLIDESRTSITLAMAYFLPFGRIMRALIRARRRGVTVQVIVPRQNDVPVVQWASRYMYEKLLRHGIRLYERKDRMLHSKVMVIDGTWSVVGSMNLDPRSLLLNVEFFAVVRSSKLAAALAAICRYERRRSEPVRMGHLRARTRWERFKHWFAWSFKRWL
jgi:cardiolipin synthase